MKRRNVIGALLLSIVFLFGFFTIVGYINPLKSITNEIENTSFIGTIGIDKNTSSQAFNVSVTFPDFSAQSSGSQGSTGGNSGSVNKLLTAQGPSVFGAEQMLYTQSPKKLNYGHISWALVGGTPGVSIADCLEDTLRDYNVGWDVYAGIIKDMSAKDFLTKVAKDQIDTSEMLTNLRLTSENLSLTKRSTLIDVITGLNQTPATFTLPYFTLQEKISSTPQDKTNLQAKCGGLAVIKDKKIYSFLDHDLSEGVCWINNAVGSDNITIYNGSGDVSSLVVLNSSAKIKTKIKNGVPSAEIYIHFKSQLTEAPADTSFPSEEAFKNLENEENDYIKAKIVNAVAYAQKNDIDIFSIGNTLMHQHPLAWRKISDQFPTLFANMKISIQVDSQILSYGQTIKSLK